MDEGDAGWKGGKQHDEKKKIWEANQGNPASQICSCGIKIGIKTREQKYTLHLACLWGGGCCYFMLALLPPAQGVNSYSPPFTLSDAVFLKCE